MASVATMPSYSLFTVRVGGGGGLSLLTISRCADHYVIEISYNSEIKDDSICNNNLVAHLSDVSLG